MQLRLRERATMHCLLRVSTLQSEQIPTTMNCLTWLDETKWETLTQIGRCYNWPLKKQVVEVWNGLSWLRTRFSGRLFYLRSLILFVSPVPVAARLLRSWVRIPPGAWMFVCCECCVLSGRGLCDELITRSEESYRLWCAVACDLETSRMRRPWPALGRSATEKKIVSHEIFLISSISSTE